jgi:hypothetical protein
MAWYSVKYRTRLDDVIVKYRMSSLCGTWLSKGYVFMAWYFLSIEYFFMMYLSIGYRFMAWYSYFVKYRIPLHGVVLS